MSILDPQFSVLSAINNARKNNKKIVFTNGCFDVLHLGHILSLKRYKEMGGFLVVAINSDRSVKFLKGQSRPFFKQEDRKIILESIKYVDAVIIYDSLRADEAIRYCAPHIYVKSSDYSLENMDKSELKAIEQVKAEIRFTPLIEGYSTSAILTR